MPRVVTKYFYNELLYVTETIGRIGLTHNLIEAAKGQDFQKVQQVFEEFKYHQPELWKRMCTLYTDYYGETWPTIFGNDEYEYFIYDSSKIDPLNLVCCCALSNTYMNPDTLFEDYRIFKIVFQERGDFEIADYIEQDELSELTDLLKIFKKD